MILPKHTLPVLLLVLTLPVMVDAAQANPLLTSYAKETRNRANVLFVGDIFTPAVATAIQERFPDGISVFRPSQPVADVNGATTALTPLLDARQWHVVVINLPLGGRSAPEQAAALREFVRRIKARNAVVVWASGLAGSDRALAVRDNDTARKVMRAEGVEWVDLYGAFLMDAEGGLPRTGMPGDSAFISRVSDTVAPVLQRALSSRSTPAATLPPGENRDPARLLADSSLLARPMTLPEAKGTTAVIFRAEAGDWQFNLHSFIAHHAGKFWAIWSSGRVDEDSSSQYLRYATSTDGFTWSPSATLAPDPDGEHGSWRWMASGIYSEDGRLFALGSLNQGFGPDGLIWANTRLVRFEWKGEAWKEDRVIGEDCAVYFPPLRVEGRDFFVWRDSRAYFHTAFSPVGSDQWEVTRLPGPLPDYRMSETGSYVDPGGVVHLIIRDQGYTRRLYHSVSYDAGGTWTVPVKTNYPDAASKNMPGRLSNGLYYLINNPTEAGANARDPLAITFSRDGWTFSNPMALRKNGPPLRFEGKAKGGHSFQYSHAIEIGGQLWVIYATNKEDIEVTAYPIADFPKLLAGTLQLRRSHRLGTD